MSRRAPRVGVGLLLLAGLASASPPPAGPGVAATPAPQWQADGSLLVPKALQRLLLIRTQALSETGPQQTVLAEVQALPGSALQLSAPEAGRLEALSTGWPLLGQSVRTGEPLARLRPQLPQRERARRQAELAEFDQRMIIARLNAERLRLQAAVNEDGVVASGNVYFEQALAELQTMERQRALLAESLTGQRLLRAGASGRIAALQAEPGQLVVAGQPLLSLADPRALRLSALSFEAGLGARIQAAQSLAADGSVQHWRYRAQEPLAGQPGWQLLFDAVANADVEPAPLVPGQLLKLRLQLAPEAEPTLPAGICVRRPDGSSLAWLHRSAEHLQPLPLHDCRLPADTRARLLATGARLVSSGAELLALYRR